MGQGLSANTVGRLISGFGERPTSLHREAVIDLDEMAKTCQVTFRPLPKGYRHPVITTLRDNLDRALRRNGVRVVPWEQATIDYRQKGFLPILRRPFYVNIRAVHNGIHAIIDVERPVSLMRRLGIHATEWLYWLTCRLSPRARRDSIPAIGRLSLWADDHAAKHIQDHTKTQVVTLTESGRHLADAHLPYDRRIRLGLALLARLFTQIAIGIHKTNISVLNMNLTDSVVDCSELDQFVRTCLVPKLFVPITPLLPSQFEVGHYEPQTTDSPQKLVYLSKALGSSGLLPSGETLSRLLKRASRRDMVKALTDGRTGVSFGFIAHIEPPCYIGPREISASQWHDLSATTVYPSDEIRRDAQDRLYARIQLNGTTVYRQIPNLWIASSRSGCDKTQLRLDRDVIRVGYDGHLHVQLPKDVSLDDDLNPSYDIRVMLAVALGAALYAPDLLANGAPLFHFHGYPHRDWFAAGEAFSGVENPAVPCGTTEAGIFNFQTMAQLASQHGAALKLGCLIEPDHGTNILARDAEYLVARVREGVERGQLTLGGQAFSTLRHEEQCSDLPTQVIGTT